MGQVHGTGSKSPLKSQPRDKRATQGQGGPQEETVAFSGEVHFNFFLNGFFFPAFPKFSIENTYHFESWKEKMLNCT